MAPHVNWTRMLLVLVLMVFHFTYLMGGEWKTGISEVHIYQRLKQLTARKKDIVTIGSLIPIYKQFKHFESTMISRRIIEKTWHKSCTRNA